MARAYIYCWFPPSNSQGAESTTPFGWMESTIEIRICLCSFARLAKQSSVDSILDLCAFQLRKHESTWVVNSHNLVGISVRVNSKCISWTLHRQSLTRFHILSTCKRGCLGLPLDLRLHKRTLASTTRTFSLLLPELFPIASRKPYPVSFYMNGYGWLLIFAR